MACRPVGLSVGRMQGGVRWAVGGRLASRAERSVMSRDCQRCDGALRQRGAHTIVRKTLPPSDHCATGCVEVCGGRGVGGAPGRSARPTGGARRASRSKCPASLQRRQPSAPSGGARGRDAQGAAERLGGGADRRAQTMAAAGTCCPRGSPGPGRAASGQRQGWGRLCQGCQECRVEVKKGP